jgi:hypothetical protein
MNGVVIESQLSLRDAGAADAVIVGSGILTREIVKDASLLPLTGVSEGVDTRPISIGRSEPRCPTHRDCDHYRRSAGDKTGCEIEGEDLEIVV